MEVLLLRLQGAYMMLAETRPGDPALRKLSGLSREIQETHNVLTA